MSTIVKRIQDLEPGEIGLLVLRLEKQFPGTMCQRGLRGLSLSVWKVCNKSAYPLSSATVASRLSITVVQTSAILKRLCDQGYLTRTEDIAPSGGLEYLYRVVCVDKSDTVCIQCDD